MVAALGAVGAAGSAHAITNDWVSDTEHPYVGLAVFYDANGEFVHRCSGSLIDPRIFLTAGHCTDAASGVVTARVYFAQDAGAHYDPVTELDPVSGYPETCAGGAATGPCARRRTSSSITGSTISPRSPTRTTSASSSSTSRSGCPSTGSSPGVLDALATGPARNQAGFTVSGYGLTKSNPQFTESYRVRLMATSRLTNLRSHNTDGFNLQTNGNGRGFGGTCSGDSGGPVLLGDTDSNLIVAVTSFGLNSWCRGVDFSYRIDRPDVLDWITTTAAQADPVGIS